MLSCRCALEDTARTRPGALHFYFATRRPSLLHHKFGLTFFTPNCTLICLIPVSNLNCHKRRFQVGVQSLSKTSSLAPGVRQLRPVIYYYEFRRRRSHS